MDGGQITAIVIVAIIMLASIVRAAVRGPRHPVTFNSGEGEAENRRLREENARAAPRDPKDGTDPAL